MFQNKNNSTLSGDQTNLSQEHDLPIEELPIHTMKNDLAELKNPALAKANEESSELASRPQPIAREKLTEAQKTSPFLDFSTPEKSAQESPVSKPAMPKKEILDTRIKFVEPTPPPAPNKEVFKPYSKPAESAPAPKKEFFEPSVKPEELAPVPKREAIKPPVKPAEPALKKVEPAPEQKEAANTDFSKIFLGIAIVLVVAILAGGGYYFWLTRQKTSTNVAITPPVETQPAPAPEPAPVAKFTTDKPNNLTIDINAATADTVKELLQNTAKAVADSKITLPVEFTLVDSDNNPVTFKTFAAKLGVALSPALGANLSDPFSLFIYNDGDVARTGLEINSKNPAVLKKLMLAEEKNLANELSPIFLTSDYTLATKPFASSDYNNLAIRYLNIISPEDLSVDYLIKNNELIIGTTKMTLRAIADKITPATAAPVPENTGN